MEVLALVLAVAAIIIAALAMIFRKPGPQGPQGETGLRGIHGEDGHDGFNGADGKDGQNGLTPVFKIEGNHLYVTYQSEPVQSADKWIDLGSIQGPQGPKGKPGKNGKDGKDAVVTTTDVLTKDQVIKLLSDGDEIVFHQPVIAPKFIQEDRNE